MEIHPGESEVGDPRPLGITFSEPGSAGSTAFEGKYRTGLDGMTSR